MSIGAIAGSITKSGGLLKGIAKFFFGSKLRTALTLGTGALISANNRSYAMGSPAMMGLGMHRGMYPGMY